MTANIASRVTPTTQTKVELVGTWLLNDNRWVSTQTPNYLLFIERTRTKVNQGCQYVLSVDPSGHRTYVSSVYPRGSNRYKIDFQGINYIIERVSPQSLCISIGISPTI
jgi:hypothetical protein